MVARIHHSMPLLSGSRPFLAHGPLLSPSPSCVPSFDKNEDFIYRINFARFLLESNVSPFDPTFCRPSFIKLQLSELLFTKTSKQKKKQHKLSVNQLRNQL